MYIIIELQTSNGQTSSLVTVKDTPLEAESVFYQILAAAAISAVEKHAAVLLTSDGDLIMTHVYNHPAE